MIKECFEVFTQANNLTKNVNIGYGYSIVDMLENFAKNESISISINGAVATDFNSGSQGQYYDCLIVIQSIRILTLIPLLLKFNEAKVSEKRFTWSYDRFTFTPSKDTNKISAYANLRFYV